MSTLSSKSDEPVAGNANVKAFQLALSGLGIPYSGNTDGVVEPEFIRAMRGLEDLIQAKTGEVMSGKLFSGTSVVMPLHEVYQKFFPEKVKTKPPLPDLPKQDIPNKIDNTVMINNAFKDFLSQELPVVGKLYTGDLEIAAKKLEMSIGQEIGKSIQGVIWNDQKKTFNTTTDDIRKALNMIATHRQNKPKTATLSIDTRFAKMAAILAESQVSD